MNDIQVLHDSQNAKFRNPFGAVEINQKVNISIIVNREIVVAIELIKFDGSKLNIGMQKEYLNDGKFKYFINIDTSKSLGILEYYFILIDGYERMYYGNNTEHLGGVGQLYTHNPVPYQITVYSRYSVPDWYKEGVIYQILIDRFYNGNENNNVNFPKENSFIYGRWNDRPMYIRDNYGRIIRWDFYGGNFKGIIKKIDYIKSLGVNIIKLTPIFKSPSHHKYDTSDYEIVDEMFGTNDDFKELCEIIKNKGMKIILDIVLSYTSFDSKYFNKLGKYNEIGAYNSPNSRFYNWYKFINYPYRYEGWWGMEDRPNVNCNESSYINYIINGTDSIINRWSKFGIDGWNLNVIDELSDSFIEIFRKRLDCIDKNIILLGDIWEDASNKISYSIKRKYLLGREIHGATNYPLRESLINFVKGYIESHRLKQRIMSLYENYPIESFYANMNIISTNDTERILTALGGNVNLLKLLVILQFTLPGVPVIYYGDEAGIDGGRDPDNRRSYPWGKENKEIIDFYHNIINLRNNEKTFKKGDFIIFESDPNLFAFERNYRNEQIIVIANVSNVLKVFNNINIKGSYKNLFEPREKYKFIDNNSKITIYPYDFKILKKI